MSNKLELIWYNKYKIDNIEPRILIENKKLSNSEKDNNTDNILIHGDNLLALRALQSKYSGKIKCIYIDPPYNTGAAFENYDDNLEHSTWLSLMKSRLEILHDLLSEDGFFCCEIDDSEGQYLKVLLDEIFGRQNYLTTMYIRVRYPEKTLKEDMVFHKEIEQIHIYRKSKKAVPNLDEEITGFDKFTYSIKEINKPDKVLMLGGKRVEVFNSDNYIIENGTGDKNKLKEVWASGTILDGNSSGRFFRDYLTGRYEEDGYGVLYKVYDIGDDQYSYRYFTGPKKIGATKGKYYQGVPMKKLNSDKLVKRIPINNFYDFAANFGNCRQEGGVSFRGGKKPEALLKMLLKYFSNKDDLILDSFCGSGSTIAVAHKMSRKWIGIEMGEQAYTHCKKRLDDIVTGKDKTGISKEENWKGGGGYKFYEVAPSLINIDSFGEPVINKEYNAEMLASAVALHEGFKYNPSGEQFWKQSVGNENSYLYVTTKFVTKNDINKIKEEMNDTEYLVIACTSYDKEIDRLYKNIKIKKIPEMLLSKCEFGKDNYNLNIIHLPEYEEELEDDE